MASQFELPHAGGADLVRRARAGSTRACEDLVRRYWPEAYRVAYLLTHDVGVAEDLAQEAVLAALRGLDGFDDGRPFAPWFRRIAANKAYDWLRQRQRRPEVIDDEAVDAGDESIVADELAERFSSEELAAALRRIDARFRAAVVLRYLVEMEPSEIAELVGVPAATVRTRIFRGLRLLEADLTRSEGGENEQAG